MAIQSTLDLSLPRSAIQDEYAEVAACPLKGFHFHTGRFLAARLGYPDERVASLPDSAVESFAGVGNPFSSGDLTLGEAVLDLGSGARFDAFLVGPHRDGRAVSVAPRHHQHPVAPEPVVAGEDVGRQVRARDVAQVQRAVGVGPCHGDEDGTSRCGHPPRIGEPLRALTSIGSVTVRGDGLRAAQ